MKLKEGLILSEVDGKYIAVAADEAGRCFSGMLKLNQTAAFIMEKMKADTTVEKLVSAVTEKYEATEEQAKQSVVAIVENLRRIRLIEE